MKILPRRPEMLQYVIRVQLRVRFKDMDKVLRKMIVRPSVLVALFDFLIDHHHVAFRGHVPAHELKRKTHAAIKEIYPVDDDTKHLPP